MGDQVSNYIILLILFKTEKFAMKVHAQLNMITVERNFSIS